MVSDRFLIYQLKHRHVEATFPSRSPESPLCVSGVVESVYRDVMEERIELRVGNETVFMQEPTVIVKKGSEISLLYGDVGMDPASDEEVFEELRSVASHGGTLQDALENTRRRQVKAVTFKLGKHKTKRRAGRPTNRELRQRKKERKKKKALVV